MKKIRKKKAVVFAILAAIFVAGGFASAVIMNNTTDKAAAVMENKNIEETVMNEGGELIAVDKNGKDVALAKEEQETIKKSEDKKTETKKSASTVAVSSKDTVKSSSSSSSSSSSTKDKVSSTTTKKETSSSNSSNNSKKPTVSKHTHNWVAVYKEVDNGHYETVQKKEAYSVCNCCGADITGNTSEHLKAHMIAGDTGVSRSTKYRYIESQEWVPNIEKVVDYYKCSCGATK